MVEKHAPRRKQGHASRRALEELRPDLFLERPDLPTHGGLRDVEALGRTPHVALLGDGDEVADLRKAHVDDHAARREPQAEARATQFLPLVTFLPGAHRTRAWVKLPGSETKTVLDL